MTQQNNKIIYYNTNFFKIKNGGISTWQGIRYVDDNIFIICGTTLPSPQKGEGIIYFGNLSFTSGQIYYLNVPNSKYTSVYGPNYDSTTGLFNFVGSYTDQSTYTRGFVYTGKITVDDLNDKLNYSYLTINNFYNIVFPHSIMNNLMVGSAGNDNDSHTLSFLYDITNLKNYIEIKYPGSLTTTSYGIWYNGHNIYTIVGGYSYKTLNINSIYSDGKPKPIGYNFIVDYNSITQKFYNWTTIALPFDYVVESHIEGISFLTNDTYSLSMDILEPSTGLQIGYYAVVKRNPITNFELEKIVQINYDNNSNRTSSLNSVAYNNIVGIYASADEILSFQAKIM